MTDAVFGKCAAITTMLTRLKKNVLATTNKRLKHA
jgi:hypothetical protein